MSFEKCPVCATPVSALDAKCPKCKAILIKEKTESHVNKEPVDPNVTQQELLRSIYEELRNKNNNPSFGRAIRTCFSNYATFRGRARRSEFWYWFLFNQIIFIGLGMLSWTAGGIISWSAGKVIAGIWGLVVLLPNLAVWVRRLHDIGKSGWNIVFYVFSVGIMDGIMISGLFPLLISSLCALMACVLLFVMFIELVKDSERHENKYGKSPKYQDENIGL